MSENGTNGVKAGKGAPAADRKARRLLEQAHDAMYRYPDGFPGFVAAVAASGVGWELAGALRVWCPHGLALERVEPPQAVGEDLAGSILAAVNRQFPRTFDEVDGRFPATFAPTLDRPRRRAVELQDHRSTVRWLDDEGLVETSFRLRDCQFRVEILERRSLPDGGWLPAVTRETVDGPDATTIREYQDEYVLVDTVYLPSRRVVVVGTERDEPWLDVRFAEHAPRRARRTRVARRPRTSGGLAPS